MSSQLRQQAIHRIRARRHFAVYVAFYLALTGYLVSLWARSGAADFWPIWPLLGGGNRPRRPGIAPVRMAAAHHRREDRT